MLDHAIRPPRYGRRTMIVTKQEHSARSDRRRGESSAPCSRPSATRVAAGSGNLRNVSMWLPLVLLAGCATGIQDESRCTTRPTVIETLPGGAEDMVALPLGNGSTRLFVREVCAGSDCGPEANRIGTVDVGPETATFLKRTVPAWQPVGDKDFYPLGMSLVLDDKSQNGALFVLDRRMSFLGRDERPPKIWRVPIVRGKLNGDPVHAPWFTGDDLQDANDLQAVGDDAYVTLYDAFGILPWRHRSRNALVKVRQSGAREGKGQPVADSKELRGANGIVDLGPGRDLVVADYWQRRLRFVRKGSNGGEEVRYATGRLPIHPDNLTLDGDRLLIAGQEWWQLAAVNLWFSGLPSPSRVLEIRVGDLGAEAQPHPERDVRQLWAGGWSYGRSVSVAVPTPQGLALGQIRAPGILQVECHTESG